MSEELRIDIKSMTLPELTALMKEWGEPGFRAGQLFSWLHEKRVTDWAEMTNLSAALRQKLAERCTLTHLTVLHRLESAIDGHPEVPLPPGGWQLHRNGADEVQAWQQPVHLHPGGLPHGLQFLCVHPGRPGAPSAAFGNAGTGVRNGAPER